MKSNRVPVLITTDHTKRGVFFGYINEDEALNDPLTVEELQMCIYWSEEVKGVLGLAATGPTKNCRIGEPVPKALVKGITLVAGVSKEAEKAWLKKPWKK